MIGATPRRLLFVSRLNFRRSQKKTPFPPLLFFPLFPSPERSSQHLHGGSDSLSLFPRLDFPQTVPASLWSPAGCRSLPPLPPFLPSRPQNPRAPRVPSPHHTGLLLLHTSACDGGGGGSGGGRGCPFLGCAPATCPPPLPPLPPTAPSISALLRSLNACFAPPPHPLVPKLVSAFPPFPFPPFFFPSIARHPLFSTREGDTQNTTPPPPPPAFLALLGQPGTARFCQTGPRVTALLFHSLVFYGREILGWGAPRLAFPHANRDTKNKTVV